METTVAGWRTSTYSSGNGGNCIEVAGSAGGAVAVRDTKDRHGPMLAFAPAAWRAFTGTLKDKK